MTTRAVCWHQYYGDDDDATAEQAELRDADCTAREAKLALWQEELTMRCEEMTAQVAAADTARGESCATADDERHANGDDAKHW